jgi:hypothetical protein
MSLFNATTPRFIDPERDLREDVELAIVKRLTTLRKDKGGPCGMVREYAGELERWTDEITAELIKNAVGGQIPAILVTASSSRYDSVSTNRDRYRGTLDVELLHVGASLRSQETRERGRDGVFRVMGHVRSLLGGVDLKIPGCSVFQLLAEESMLHTPDLCVWKQTLSVVVNGANVPVPDGQPITELWSRGNYPEIAGVGDSLVAVGGSVTLTDAAGGFHRDLLGMSIVLTGATSAGNNGTFTITDVPDAGEGTQIVFANGDGVTEAFNGTWTVKRLTPLITAKHTL